MAGDTEAAVSPPARIAEGWTWLSGGPSSSQPEEGRCDQLGAALDTQPGPGQDARLLLPRAPVLRATLSTWLGSDTAVSGTCSMAAGTTATLLHEGPMSCLDPCPHQLRACSQQPHRR